MMLSGLEQENVLKSLASGNLDIVVNDKILGMSIDVPSKYLSFNSQGILLVSKSFGSLSQSVGNQVVVQFYVNHVGYCFDSILQDSSMGLAVVVPKKINRVKSKTFSKPQSFMAKLFYLDENEKPVTIPCSVPETCSLLTRPAWDDVPARLQDECRMLMTRLVNERKQEGNSSIGNGMHLISVVGFLCDPEAKKTLGSVQGTQPPLDLIYIDGEKIILGKRKYAHELELESDYTLALDIILSAFLTRSIQLECTVSDIYSTSSDPVCYLCRITKIKAEDERFISERMKVL